MLADRTCQDGERECAAVTAVPVASRSRMMVLCSGSLGPPVCGPRCWWRDEEARLGFEESEWVIELELGEGPEIAAR